MAFDTLGRKDLRIDAFPVVPHPQPEFVVVVADLDLDQPGLRVMERIPQRFRRNLVDFVAQDRVQVPRLSFHADAECRRRRDARVGRQPVAEGSNRYREIGPLDRRRP